VLGARDAQIETVSFGKEKPRALGSTEEAWAQNRRADIVYK
jgi:peptidoglycan-associated lipoprotein